MTAEQRMSITSNDFANAIIDCNRNDEFFRVYSNYFINQVDEKYGVTNLNL